MNPISTPFRFVIVGSGNISRTYLKAIRTGREPAVPAKSGRLASELILMIYGNDLLNSSPLAVKR